MKKYSSSSKNTEICNFFLQNGHCKYGNNCKYLHVVPIEQIQKNAYKNPKAFKKPKEYKNPKEYKDYSKPDDYKDIQHTYENQVISRLNTVSNFPKYTKKQPVDKSHEYTNDESKMISVLLIL